MSHNGNNFEMWRLLGNLEAHMQHQSSTQDRHTEILLDIKDSLGELPSRLATTISPASANPKPRILPEVSELLRSLYPLLILSAAVLGKTTWPTALPLIRAALEAVTRGAG